MRKFLQLALIIAAAVPLSTRAEIVNVGEVPATPYFIPGTFTIDGDDQLSVRVSDNDKYTDGEYNIYDSSFRLLKTITSPNGSDGYVRCIMPYTSNGEGERMYQTQTLFNKDAEYEWMVLFEEERTYRVFSESGVIVAEIEYPENCRESDEPRLYTTNDGNCYLCLNLYKYIDGGEYIKIIYRIDRDSSSITQVGEPIKVAVHPTAMCHGTPVTVELGETSGRCNVALIASDGRVVVNERAHGDKVTIDTSSLPAGMYIVNVTDNKGTREATKIVVR